MGTKVTASVMRIGAVALLAAAAVASSVAAADDTDPTETDPSTEEPAEKSELQDTQQTDVLGACWDIIESAPFVDTVDLSEESKTAIDCVYHYAITRGTSAATFSPTDPVIRSHMALFLVRVSRILGLAVPEEAAATFEDLGGVGAEGRLAIAQLKEMGITEGYSPQVFGPANPVARVHMAQFLVRLLRLTEVILPAPAEALFEDAAGLSAAAQSDISLMVQLGIMDPVAPGRFDPRAVVTREDMALFLSRILELAEVAPVSLELSLSSDSLLVGGAAVATIRAGKPDGSPYPGLLVDVFADRGWRERGACNLDVDARLNGGDAGTSEDCRIDAGDPRTDSDGEVAVGLAHSTGSAVDWIYAWAGALGQEFHETDVRTEAKQRIEWLASPTRVTIPKPFGAVFKQNLSIVVNLVGPNSAGRRMVMISSYDDLVRVTRIENTNEDGNVAFGLPGLIDPTPDVFRPFALEETVLVFWDRNGNNIHDGPAELSAMTTVYWS